MGDKKRETFAVGIDLGTTFSSVSYIDHRGVPRTIHNSERNSRTPSCVSFIVSQTPASDPFDELVTYVGDEAERHRHLHPSSTFYQIKRFIGKQKCDKIENEKWPFQVLQDSKKNLAFRVDNELMYPEEISAVVLNEMKEIAEEHLRSSVTEAVITVPSYFDNRQRKATIMAAEIAGLKVLTLLNETTAAAIVHAFNSSSADSTRTRTILVYDLGGGAFEVSIVKMEGYRKAEVISSEGIMDLGGEDFDRMLFEDLQKQLAEEDLTMSDNWEALKKCREAKIKLSSAEIAEIVITVQPNNQKWGH